MSLFEVVSAYSTTAMSIALPSIQKDLSISSYTVTLLALTIYSGPFVFGSLIAAPLSEVFGRVRILQISNLFFIGFVAGCGAATSATQLIVFRALLGLVGSVPPVIAPGVIGETFRPESRERAQAVGLYVAIQLVGNLMGPIFGGITVQYASWRWIFYSTAIFSGVAQLMAMFFVDETCGVILARRKRKRENPDEVEKMTLGKLWRIVVPALKRPLRLLLTLIIPLISVLLAYSNGMLYLFNIPPPICVVDILMDSIVNSYL